MGRHKIALLILILVGFALRVYYLTTTHPFFDEYTTVLAARQIVETGWPILPSGLFYEHGLLATYLIAPFTALFIDQPAADWQAAHWGLMLARWPSAILSTLTIPVIYQVGCKALAAKSTINRAQSHPSIRPHASAYSGCCEPLTMVRSAALLAAGLFAISPEGMVWGGRARMYALATLLVVLLVYLAYRGTSQPAAARFRWLALLTLLAALLTQLGVLILIPPLLIAMLVNGLITTRSPKATNYPPQRAWFRQKTVLLEGLALASIIGVAIFIKRLGRPIGFTSLDSDQSSNLLTELLKTISYQTTFHFTWADTVQFFARQFGVPHHLWLTLATLTGASLGLLLLAPILRRPIDLNNPGTSQFSNLQSPISNPQSPNLQSPISILQSPFYTPFNLFLWLTFGLVILEMVTLLDPFRRNPRYLVMVLPLFYLIAAYAIFDFVIVVEKVILTIRRRHYDQKISTTEVAKKAQRTQSNSFFLSVLSASSVFSVVNNFSLTIVIFTIFTLLNLSDLRLALVTPEPAYEQAFAKIQADWQPDDILLTMNTPAAGLYLGRVDGFTIQNEAEQFLLNAETDPVDRWLGAPWIGSASEFNALLNAHPRTWFVTDTIRQPVYFRGDWQAILKSQMEQFWINDNILVYRTRADRTPLPTQPDTLVNANLDHSVELIGFSLTQPAPSDPNPNPTNSHLDVTLFWQTLTPLQIDYTTFLHLRTSDGVTIVQRDSQPLEGSYPTSHWQPRETVIDPVLLALPADLPAGSYQLYTGLYQLDTLARLPVTNDTSGENAVLLGEITLP